MINTDITPWNIFNSFSSPNRTVYGSEIIQNNEYYVSFMPPLFFPNNEKEIMRVRNRMNIESLSFEQAYTQEMGTSYISQFPRLFEDDKLTHTVNAMYRSIHMFYAIEEKILSQVQPKQLSSVEVLGLIHYIANASQAYIHTIESFCTGKQSALNPFFYYFHDSKKLAMYQERLPLTDSSFIPLSILHDTSFSNTKEYNTLFCYLSDILGIDSSLLQKSMRSATHRYNYSQFMDIETAYDLCSSVSRKIDSIIKEGKLKRTIAKLLNLNGLLTWSKLIYYKNSPQHRRFDSYHIWYPFVVRAAQNIHEFNSSDLIILGTSTTEKEAKIFYILHTIFQKHTHFKNKIIDSSKKFEQTFSLH